jgi:hypothetical protein
MPLPNIIFNGTGRFFAREDDATPREGMAVVECPDNVAAWRLFYDYDTSTLSVQYEGMTDSEAETQKDADMLAEAEARAAAREAELAAN